MAPRHARARPPASAAAAHGRRLAGCWKSGGAAASVVRCSSRDLGDRRPVPVSFAFPTFSDTRRRLFRPDRRRQPAQGLSVDAAAADPGVVLRPFSASASAPLRPWRTSEWLLIPVFIVLQAAPVAAFIPLVTFIYGIGITAKTLAVMILALPVIVLNTYKAVRNVHASLIQMCRSFLGTPLAADLQDRPARCQPGDLRRPSPWRRRGLRRRRARRTADHADRHRRPHHLSSLARRLCRDVRHHRLDHRAFDPDADGAAMGRDARLQAGKEAHDDGRARRQGPAADARRHRSHRLGAGLSKATATSRR